MSNRHGFSKVEWSIILPVKLEIRKELRAAGYKFKRGKLIDKRKKIEKQVGYENID